MQFFFKHRGIVSSLISAFVIILLFLLVPNVKFEKVVEEEEDSEGILLGSSAFSTYEGYELETVASANKPSGEASGVENVSEQHSEEADKAEKNYLVDDSPEEDVAALPASSGKEKNKATEAKQETEKQKINPKYLFSSDDTSSGSDKGNSAKNGSNAPGSADVEGQDREGTPQGGEGSGYSGFGGIKHTIANRKLEVFQGIAEKKSVSGTVVVRIKVDRNGKVIYAKVDSQKSTLIDSSIWSSCEIAMYGSRFNKATTAPEIQSGEIVFKFKEL